MSSGQPDYYKILGVSPYASAEEIKKKYRTLARKYHPDVNKSVDAAQKIKEVNEAYHQLGDTERRSVYDAHRVLDQQQAKAASDFTENLRRNREDQAPTEALRRDNPRPERTVNLNQDDLPPEFQRRSPGGSQGRDPQSSRTQKVDYNGFGTTPRQNTPPPPRPKPAAASSSPPPPPPNRAAAFGTVERMVKEAQLAYVNRNYKEAENLCGQVLLIDRRNAVAQEMLGDISVKKGNREAAATHYSYAAQFNPRNLNAQTKLENLMGGAAKKSGPTMTTPIETSLRDRLKDSPNRDGVLFTVSAGLLIVFFGMLALLWSHKGLPFQSLLFWLSDFSPNLIGAMLVNGVITGILLALYGNMRPIKDELLIRGTLRGDDRSPVTLGTLLTVFALFWFYSSFLLYIGIALAKNRFSLSIIRSYGMTLLLTVLFAFLYNTTTAGSLQVAAFAGNFLFPAVLFGWAVGDALRLHRN